MLEKIAELVREDWTKQVSFSTLDADGMTYSHFNSHTDASALEIARWAVLLVAKALEKSLTECEDSRQWWKECVREVKNMPAGITHIDQTYRRAIVNLEAAEADRDSAKRELGNALLDLIAEASAGKQEEGVAE